MTRDDIAAVIATIPNLTNHGIGLFDQGRGLSMAERQAELQ